MGIGKVIHEARAEETVGSVVDFLNRKLPHVREKQPMKAGDWIRASDIPHLCPREEVLAARMQKVRESQVGANLEWWFGVGTAIHYLFQARFLGPQGVLLGMWMCLKCGRLYGGSGKERIPCPEECFNCSHDRFFLREERVFNDEFLVDGHMDGVVVLPGAEEAVVDFKSCSASRFESLKKKPDANAVVQIQSYMWLSGIRRAVILYINKQEMIFENCLAEHWIEYDERVVADVQEKVRSIRKGLEGGPLPERICSRGNVKRAVECKCRNRCFLPGDGS